MDNELNKANVKAEIILENPPALPALSVANYRAFRRLEIERLGPVNLIVGKNNVGKTCLLEALWLYGSRGSPDVLKQVLTARNELDTRATDESQLSATRHLFHGREEPGKDLEAIRIEPEPAKELTLRLIPLDKSFLQRVEDAVVLPDSLGTIDIVRHLANRGFDSEAKKLLESSMRSFASPPSGEMGLILTVQWDGQVRIINEKLKQINALSFQEMPAQFISSNGLDDAQVARLWNRIYLTDLQDQVEEALRIIEPEIRNVGLVKSVAQNGRQTPQARLLGQKEPVLLTSLGEGMNRIFGLTLALVNARDGLLLVDEVGSGLHYSVQPRLWDFIFAAAQRLNVQVFATSHSWDTVEAFQQAAQNHPQLEGMLISLRNKQDAPGEVIGTLFDEEDLAYVTRQQIEVR